MDAAACGDLDHVRELLSSPELTSEIINKTDKDGKSAFHYACLNDDAKLLRVLLADPRVNVFQTSKNGDTGLHMASLYSSLESISLLHADGRIDINAQNKFGETPLHLCAGSGDKGASKTANLLLNFGAKLTVTDKWNRGPKDVSHDNAENPIVATFMAYLDDRTRCSQAEHDHVMAISVAYKTKETDDSSVTKKMSIFGLGDLKQVQLKKTTTVLKTMFRAQEGLTLSDKEKTTEPSIMKDFLSMDTRTPLSKLIDFPGDLQDIHRQLAKHDSVNPAGADAFGLTALHKFASWNKVAYLEALLPHLNVSDLNAVDPEGKTALHYAVEMASVGAVKCLVAAGANVDAMDGKGRTVGMILDQAAASGVIDRLKNALTGN